MSDNIISRPRLTVFAVSSFVLSAVAVFIIRDPAFTVSFDLPIGSMPFPAAYWALVILYGVMINLTFRDIPFVKAVSSSILAGLIVHMTLLLAGLIKSAHAGVVPFSSTVYKIYLKFFAQAVFLTISCAAGYVLTRFKSWTSGGSQRPLAVVSWIFTVLSAYLLYFFVSNDMPLPAAVNFSVFTLGLIVGLKPDAAQKAATAIKIIKDILLARRSYLALIFVLALAVRIVYLLRIMADSNYLATGADGITLDRLAWNFALKGEYTEIFRNGYWIFLAGIFKVFGHNYFTACFIQSLLGAISCIFVYYIALYLFGRATAIAASLLAALNFSMIFSAVSYGHLILDTFYMLAVFYIISFCQYNVLTGTRRRILLSAAGIIMGLAVPVREYNIVFIPLVVFWLFFNGMRARPLRERIYDALTVLLFSALAIAPFIYLNLKNLGVIYWVKAGCREGYSLSDWFSNVWGAQYEDMRALGLGSFSKDITNIVPVVISKGWPAVVIIAKAYGWGISELYFNCSYGSFDPLFLVRNSAYFLTLWLYAYMLTFSGMILAVFKYRTLEKGRGVISLIFLYLFYRTAVHVLLYYCAYRFRTPMEPFLIIFGAFCLIYMLRLASNR